MLALIAMLTAAAPAVGTTYLDCTTRQPSSAAPLHWHLALNEQEGTVDVASDVNNGRSDGRRPASFTADTVQFMGFTLSRVNLTMEREVNFGGMDLGRETGQCSVVQPPKRAF